MVLKTIMYISSSRRACFNTHCCCNTQSCFRKSGVSPGICISNKFPGDADATGPGTTLLSTTAINETVKSNTTSGLSLSFTNLVSIKVIEIIMKEDVNSILVIPPLI